jgi:putative ABC transport system permease protein
MGSPQSIRWYRALARLLPPDIRGDADVMSEDLAKLWNERRSGVARARLVAVAFVRLTAVVLLEWLEFLGVIPAPGRTNHRRSGMTVWRNFRFALRTLVKAPSFAITSVLLVAVGVGAVTSIFTLVDHVLLRPLPYPNADRLVYIDQGSHSGPFFRQMEQMRTGDLWSAASTQDVNLVGSGEPLRLNQARVNSGFAEMFGMRAQRGRVFGEEDYRDETGMVLTADAFERVWGSDPGVVGKALEIDGQMVTVIGVLDRGFVTPELMLRQQPDFLRPMDWSNVELQTSYGYQSLSVAARLASGSSIEAMQSELNAVVRPLAATEGNFRQSDGSPRVFPVVALQEITVRGVRTGLGLLLGAVSMLLLVACANVAHLFLARGLGRTREMAIRRAVGAGTGSLVGQLLVESLAVGLIGGTLGTALAWLGIQAFIGLNPTALPRQSAVSIDPRVLAFAVGVSALTSLVFGLLPALRSVRSELSDELRGAGRNATPSRGIGLLRNALVTGEIALSLVLVASAGILLKSFLTVRAQDPGFDMADVWTVPLNPTEVKTAQEYVTTMNAIREAMRRVPGVQSVAYAWTQPLEWTQGRCCWNTAVTREGVEGRVRVFLHPVSPDYFRTLGIELRAGRTWEAHEVTVEPPPIVINEPMAIAFYGSAEAALGRPFTMGRRSPVVVGVIADVRHYGLENEHGNALYLPIENTAAGDDEMNPGIASFAVKVDPRIAGSVPSMLREAVWSVAPRIPAASVMSMEDLLANSTASRRFDSLIFGTFAAVTLLLTTGGLYGTLLYVAGQRKREVGIRLALGASRGRIERQVVATGAVLGIIGILFGLLGAWTSGKLLESRIWGVEARDPGTLLIAAGLLLVTALVASWLPARRAGRVDPLDTLRMD